MGLDCIGNLHKDLGLESVPGFIGVQVDRSTDRLTFDLCVLYFNSKEYSDGVGDLLCH